MTLELPNLSSLLRSNLSTPPLKLKSLIGLTSTPILKILDFGLYETPFTVLVLMLAWYSTAAIPKFLGNRYDAPIFRRTGNPSLVVLPYCPYSSFVFH